MTKETAGQASATPEPEENPAEQEIGRAIELTGAPIEIKLEFPADFIAFLVPAADARTTHHTMRKNFRDWLYDCELDDYMKAVVFNTKLSMNVLPNAEVEEFYQIVEDGPLPVKMQSRCFQAEMIVQLLAEGDDQLTFFAPFWTAMIAGHFYSTDLDAILVDVYNSAAYPADTQFWRFQSLGVPLTHQFLSVIGNSDERSGRLSMHTTGMRRFGLPELEINEVNPAFGQDIAYFLRGLGQYMWSAIEKLIPASTTFKLAAELDFSTSFCELDKSTALNMHGDLLPVSLCWSDSGGAQPRLVLEPTIEFETEDHWFHLIVQTLRQSKYQLDSAIHS